MKELKDVLIMKDDADYHEGTATKRRKEYENEGDCHE